MDVLIVTEGRFPPDIRIEEELVALQEAGYSSAVLAGHGERHESRTIPACLTYYFSSYALKGFPLVTPANLLKWLEKIQPRIVHVHNVQIGLQTAFACRLLKIPCVLDLREIWSLLVLDDQPGLFWRTAGYVLFTFLELLETRTSDITVVNTEEAKTTVMKRYGISESKLRVISNLVSKSDFDGIEQASDPYLKERFVMCYFGGLDRVRNLENVLLAIRHLGKVRRDAFRLIIIGGKPESRLEYLRQFCAKIEIQDNVIFKGWLPLKQSLSYVMASDVCIIPHKKSAFTDNTIPYKLNQYMGLAKAIITTPMAPVMRLFSGIVIIWDGSSPERLAQIIEDCMCNENGLIRLGKRGRELFLSTYNWDVERKQLLSLYESLRA